MDWTPILEWLLTLAPWVSYLFMTIGTLVIIGIAVDAIIPDEKDKGFMKKALALPLIGALLKALKCFSPLNHK